MVMLVVFVRQCKLGSNYSKRSFVSIPELILCVASFCRNNLVPSVVECDNAVHSFTVILPKQSE